jgi:uncharacterized membrane protein HdeD (DUF308 family)
MELFTSVILGLVAIALGVALVIYAFKVANHKRDVLLTGGNVRNGFYNS